MLSEKLFQCDQMCLETGPRRQNPPPSFITVFISVYILRPHLWVTCVSVHFWIDKYRMNPLREVCVLYICVPGSFFCLMGRRTHSAVKTFLSTCWYIHQEMPLNEWYWFVQLVQRSGSALEAIWMEVSSLLTGAGCLPLYPGLPGCYWHATLIDVSKRMLWFLLRLESLRRLKLLIGCVPVVRGYLGDLKERGKLCLTLSQSWDRIKADPKCKFIREVWPKIEFQSLPFLNSVKRPKLPSVLKIDHVWTTGRSLPANCLRGDKMRNVPCVSTNGNRWREFGSVARGWRLSLSGLLSQEQELSNHQQMSKWTNMWPWCRFVCKYLSLGAVKGDWGECWGAPLRLLTQSQTTSQWCCSCSLTPHPSPAFFFFNIPNICDPEHPPPLHTSRYSFKESCQSPKVKGTHFAEGAARVRGRRLTAASLGWNELWWQVVLLMCQQWRSNRPRWSAGLFITLTAGITINLLSGEWGGGGGNWGGGGIHLAGSKMHFTSFFFFFAFRQNRNVFLLKRKTKKKNMTNTSLENILRVSVQHIFETFTTL